MTRFELYKNDIKKLMEKSKAYSSIHLELPHAIIDSVVESFAEAIAHYVLEEIDVREMAIKEVKEQVCEDCDIKCHNECAFYSVYGLIMANRSRREWQLKNGIRKEDEINEKVKGK